MLGPDNGKIAPDLAPPVGAIGIFQPNQHRRPIMHSPERRPNGNIDGGSEYKGFCLGELDGFYLMAGRHILTEGGLSAVRSARER